MERGDYERDLTRIITGGLAGYIADKTGASVVVDKMTPVEREDVAERIKSVFPDAKCAYLVRDGRDIAVSFLFDWLTKAHRASGAIDTESARFKRFVAKEEVDVFRLFTDEEIAEYAGRWVKAIRIFRPLATHVFSYEDMKIDLGAVLRNYFDFLGVGSDDAVIEACLEASSFKSMSGGKGEGDASRVSSATRRGVARGWVDYFTREDGRIFNEAAGDLLLEFGYESDPAWFEDLPDKLQTFSAPPDLLVLRP
ncbi:sulfotransferase domain-containing protein [Hyphococcus luteus]|uniref:sulfotransferase domain-containing protein n=1 Tax=Hyphococcus luteus TaxID=2058213 RepID=UPI0013FD411F|nr:sulfotransferase domain-containing protein [Marinicaulis flavus]